MTPVVMREALPRGEIEKLGSIAKNWYAALPTSDYPRKDDWLMGRGATLPNCPAMYDIFALFDRSPAASLCREHVGPILAIPYNHALMRWRGPHTPVDHVGFHRDRDAIAETYPMNAWIPLTQIDRDTLGLAFDVDGTIIEPTFEPGDLVIFNRDTLHGSLPPKPRDRISIEFRMGPALKGMDGVSLGV
jgi:hypothetical protein